MKLLALLLVLLAATGCRSSRGGDEAAEPERRSRKRDSIAFLWEGVRGNRELRAQTRRFYREGRPGRRALRKDGVRFLWESLTADQIYNWKIMLGDLRDERKTVEERLRSMTFGFRDNG